MPVYTPAFEITWNDEILLSAADIVIAQPTLNHTRLIQTCQPIGAEYSVFKDRCNKSNTLSWTRRIRFPDEVSGHEFYLTHADSLPCAEADAVIRYLRCGEDLVPPLGVKVLQSAVLESSSASIPLESSNGDFLVELSYTLRGRAFVNP